MACATPAVEYAWKLQKYIQQLFANGVIPSNVLPVFHKYNLNVLTKADVDNIYAVIDAKGDYAGAVCLLEKIHIYDSWFECLTTVLRDPDVKLSHLADKLEEYKSILDSKLEQEREHPEEEVRKLREEIHKRDQKIMELEAGSNKHKQVKEEASQVTGTHSHKKKLTGKVYTELENLDNTIEQERMEHEVKLRQLEQEKDHAIAQERKRWEEEVKEREQQLPEQRAEIRESDLARQGAGPVTRAHNRNKQLTRKRAHRKLLDHNMAQKCRRLNDEVRRLKEEKEQEQRRHEEEIEQVKEERDCTIGQEHKRFEEEAKRREQESEQQRYQIKKLKEEREKLEQVIQQEREHQSKEIKKLREETRQKAKIQAEILHLLSTKNSDGVILWNYCVKYWMTIQYPDMAKKYGLTMSSLPPHLQEAEWMAIWFDFCRKDFQEVNEHGLTVAKDSIQARLRNILNKVNMGRRENEDDVIIKYKLQCDIRDFFSSCYYCILGLDKHPVNSVKECLMYIKDSITENMDPLVEEFGGWNDVMSETTCSRYWKAMNNRLLQQWSILHESSSKGKALMTSSFLSCN